MHTKKIFNKALAALNSNDLKNARKSALKLTKLDRDNSSAWHIMAVIHGKLGETALAESAFVKAASLAPTTQDRGLIYEQLGKFLMESHRPGRAAKYFAELQSLAPDRPDAVHFLAESYRLSRRYRLALVEYDRAIAMAGEQPEILVCKADCLQKLGQPHEAIRCLTQVLSDNPNNIDAVCALARCYVDIDAYDKAASLLQSSIDFDPGNAQFHYELALLNRDFGKLQKAEISFLKTLSLEPDATTVYYNLSRIKRFHAEDPIIEKMKLCLARLSEKRATNSQQKGRTELLFALGKIAEDSQQYEQAFCYWKEANTLKRQSYNYKIGNDRKRFAATQKIFCARFLEERQLDSQDQPVPIFILGMPRAGSTLCEQILSSHTEIRGMGELTLLPDLLGELEGSLRTPFPQVMTRVDKRSLQKFRDNYMTHVMGKVDRHFFTDKLPGNFRYIGLIRILFPQSIIIHAHRNPIDTGFSCYKHLFSGTQKFAYDLTEIGQYILLYRELMAYWHKLLPDAIFDLRYEDLVANPEETARSMLSFCGLQWQQDCLNFYETRRAVKSSSAAQIRRPMYTGAVGFWQHYREHLRELTDLV